MTDTRLFDERQNRARSMTQSLMSRFDPEKCRLNLRVLTFSMMLAVAVVPIVAFYKWVEKTSFQNELKQVDDNHLVIAKNLSSTLSRYVTDATAVFDFVIPDEEGQVLNPAFATLLKNFHICNVTVIDSNNQIVSQILGANSNDTALPDHETLTDLRKLAAEKPGDVVISGIRDHFGESRFFFARQLDDGKLALSPWSPGYVRDLQNSIAFGKSGHSMMVDQYGRVIAHPNADWQSSMKDASPLSVVQAMMAGQTGVMQFYSPPMDADMIAGFTFVPETGWGVMVPQPIQELEMRADAVQRTALFVTGIVVCLAAFVSFWFSSVLNAPIVSLVGATRRVAEGDHSARADNLPRITPCEIRKLAKTFNDMVDDVARKSQQLTEKLHKEKQLSMERATLLTEAQRANKIKSQFLSTISHELRTPLTSIRGSLELMGKGVFGPMSDKAHKMNRIAICNAARLQELIDDILDMEKLDSGHMVFRKDRVDLNAIVSEAVEANESFGHIHGVTFNWAPAAAPTIVTGDSGKLMQVMANLLSNAAKFSDGKDHVDVSLTQTETSVRVTVRDYGIGIAQKDHSKLFEKFVQVDSDDARRFGGSGLGLAITRMIIENHNGTVDFESVSGKGSTFWFEMPLA